MGWKCHETKSHSGASIIHFNILLYYTTNLITFKLRLLENSRQKFNLMKKPPFGKSVKKSLVQSEKYFRCLVENNSEGMMLVDAMGKVLFQNKAALQITGYSLEEMQGLDPMELIHPDDREQEKHFFANLASSVGATKKRSHLFLHKRGNYIWLEGVYTNMLDEKNVNAIGYNFHDSTENKNNGAQQRLLVNIVNSSDDGIISKTLNGTITSWNLGAERIFGYKAEEVVGKNVHMLIPPERFDEEPQIIQRIIRGEHVEHYETVRTRKDKSLIDVSLSISPLTDSNGIITGASKIVRDITLQKRSEQIILEEKEKLNLVIENMNAGVVVADLHGNFTLFNESAEQILGIGAKNVPLEELANVYGVYCLDKITPFPPDELPIAKAIRG